MHLILLGCVRQTIEYTVPSRWLVWVVLRGHSCPRPLTLAVSIQSKAALKSMEFKLTETEVRVLGR